MPSQRDTPTIFEAILRENETRAENITTAPDFSKYEEGLNVLMANIDDLFLTTMGSMIILMQAGFAFLEAGSVRAKNTTNILIKNFADLCFGGLSFWLTGYALAFGEGNGILGLTNFAAIDLPHSKYTYLFFQCTFAATCATIVSGAIAERCHFNGYIIFSAVITGLIYPIPTHWCWGETGWLAQRGFYDFAGGGVVHMAGGICALVGAMLLGPRIDRFRDEHTTYIAGHSFPLITLGGFILVMGFMAFNGGSQGSISHVGDGESVGRAVVATLVSCASGGATVLMEFKFFGGHTWSLARIVNGCLTGMVSVASGCDGYTPWMACLIAIIAGNLYLFISRLLVKLKIDDPVDAVAVHCGSGLLGLILSPILRQEGVILTGGSKEAWTMLMWNSIGAVCIIFYYLVISAVFFYTLDKAGLFRVDAKAEVVGLDIVKHNEKAYDYGTLSVMSLPEHIKMSVRSSPMPKEKERHMSSSSPNITATHKCLTELATVELRKETQNINNFPSEENLNELSSVIDLVKEIKREPQSVKSNDIEVATTNTVANGNAKMAATRTKLLINGREAKFDPPPVV